MFDREDWVTIKDVGGTYKGEIYLEMTFFAAGPPSLERRPSKLPPQERLQHLKYNKAPTAGGSLAVAGAHAHGYSPPRNDKPAPPVQISQGPAPLPSMLRPGAGFDKANGQGGRPDGYTSPINSRPPSSLFPARPPTSPAHQPNNASPFNIPGQYPPTPPGHKHSFSHSPPHPGHSPPMPSHSHSPPRQSKPEHNPYVSDPAPPSNQGSSFFPSPQILVDSTPPDPAPWNPFGSGSNYNPPQLVAQPGQPMSTFPGGPTFPSVSPQQPPPGIHPTQQRSPTYPPPQSPFSPPQPGYSPPQSTYQPPSQPGYPFPPHQSTYPGQHQGTYPTYGHTSPAPGPGQRPFFGREGSIGEVADPALMQRYSSPLPLPYDTNSGRSTSPFPVPSVSPSHSTTGPYSPSAEYERELQRRREQEERDAELARQLDHELNLRG